MKSILVLDFGGQAALVAARKLRGARVFSRIVDAEDVSPALLDTHPAGIVIAGGDGEGAEIWKKLDPALLEAGVPVLAMGPSALWMLDRYGGQSVERRLYREAALAEFAPCDLFDGVPMSERFFIEGHALALGDQWEELGALKSGVSAAFRHRALPLYGVQFYVEPNDPDGWSILNNFASRVCGCEPEWQLEAFCDFRVRELAACQGDVLIAVSGGIDSAVCAELMRQAVGDRLHCLFVDTGLMRKGEVEAVRDMFVNRLHMKLDVVDAQERIWAAIRGVSSAHEKRITIRSVLYDVLAEYAESLGGVPNLVQGTIYTDVIANRRGHGVKNKRMEDSVTGVKKQFERVIEPLDALFKEEVRRLGEVLHLPAELVHRQPFPSMGLAQRIQGEVTVEKLNILREADAILTEEVSSAGLDKRLYQYFCVLTEMATPGIKEGRPVTERVLALRAVSSHDSMSASAMRMPYDVLERLVQRIVELPGINRVVYDLTPTPVADVEWL